MTFGQYYFKISIKRYLTYRVIWCINITVAHSCYDKRDNRSSAFGRLYGAILQHFKGAKKETILLRSPFGVVDLYNHIYHAQQ